VKTKTITVLDDLEVSYKLHNKKL